MGNIIGVAWFTVFYRNIWTLMNEKATFNFGTRII